METKERRRTLAVIKLPIIHLKHSYVPTSQKTRRASIIKTSQIMLFGEIITAYCESLVNCLSTLCAKKKSVLMLNGVLIIFTVFTRVICALFFLVWPLKKRGA